MAKGFFGMLTAISNCRSDKLDQTMVQLSPERKLKIERSAQEMASKLIENLCQKMFFGSMFLGVWWESFGAC